jgi:hypothetical protein
MAYTKGAQLEPVDTKNRSAHNITMIMNGIKIILVLFERRNSNNSANISFIFSLWMVKEWINS